MPSLEPTIARRLIRALVEHGQLSCQYPRKLQVRYHQLLLAKNVELADMQMHAKFEPAHR